MEALEEGGAAKEKVQELSQQRDQLKAKVQELGSKVDQLSRAVQESKGAERLQEQRVKQLEVRWRIKKKTKTDIILNGSYGGLVVSISGSQS